MRKFILSAMIGLGVTLIAVAPVAASQGNPHQEESDGSDHGNTGKPPKEDPSENGKDCDVHGNHGGVNEDHCNGETTTTTVPPTTTTTEPAVDEPTTTTTIPVVEEPTTTTTIPVVEEPTTTTTVPVVVVDEPTTTTTVPVVVVPAPAPATDTPAPSAEVPASVTDQPGPDGLFDVPVQTYVPPTPTAPVSELPHTGLSGWLLALGMVFLGSGIISIAIGKLIAG